MSTIQQWGIVTWIGGLVIALSVGGQPAVAENPAYIGEALPDAYLAKIEVRDRQLANYLPIAGDGQSFVIEETKTWGPGAKIRVAFRGGSEELRQKIAEVAATWAQYANVKLDFLETGHPREWMPTASDYTAEVRVGFDQPGYWSVVGNDSIDSNVAAPGEASMNFQGFDQRLPADWQATVLHEFGHALGFQHEHQHPLHGCDEEFRWADEQDYVPTVDARGQFGPDSNGRWPGVYTWLGGPPNRWPKLRVDFNMRQLQPSHAYRLGSFDAHSIMKYYFPDWMFVRGKKSSCYSEQNVVLSDQDKDGVGSVYPRRATPALNVLDQRIAFLRELLKAEGMPGAIRRPFEALLQAALRLKQEIQGTQER